MPDDEWGEIVVAAVEPQPGVEPSDALADPSSSSGAGTASRTTSVPAVSIFVEALPRHDNGKLYKHQLREQLRTK